MTLPQVMALFAAAALWVVVELCLHAPLGWQDDTGYHAGKGEDGL